MATDILDVGDRIALGQQHVAHVAIGEEHTRVFEAVLEDADVKIEPERQAGARHKLMDQPLMLDIRLWPPPKGTRLREDRAEHRRTPPNTSECRKPAKVAASPP